MFFFKCFVPQILHCRCSSVAVTHIKPNPTCMHQLILTSTPSTLTRMKFTRAHSVRYFTDHTSSHTHTKPDRKLLLSHRARSISMLELLLHRWLAVVLPLLCIRFWAPRTRTPQPGLGFWRSAQCSATGFFVPLRSRFRPVLTHTQSFIWFAIRVSGKTGKNGFRIDAIAPAAALADRTHSLIWRRGTETSFMLVASRIAVNRQCFGMKYHWHCGNFDNTHTHTQTLRAFRWLPF